MATAKSEKFEIARSGGVAQKNSGRGKKNKGDAILGPYNFDVKEYSKSYSISRESWAKVSSDALKSGSYEPAIKVVLGKDGESKMRLWIISDEMFHQMLGAWEEKYE